MKAVTVMGGRGARDTTAKRGRTKETGMLLLFILDSGRSRCVDEREMFVDTDLVIKIFT